MVLFAAGSSFAGSFLLDGGMNIHSKSVEAEKTMIEPYVGFGKAFALGSNVYTGYVGLGNAFVLGSNVYTGIKIDDETTMEVLGSVNLLGGFSFGACALYPLSDKISDDFPMAISAMAELIVASGSSLMNLGVILQGNAADISGDAENESLKKLDVAYALALHLSGGSGMGGNLELKYMLDDTSTILLNISRSSSIGYNYKIDDNSTLRASINSGNVAIGYYADLDSLKSSE